MNFILFYISDLGLLYYIITLVVIIAVYGLLVIITDSFKYACIPATSLFFILILFITGFYYLSPNTTLENYKKVIQIKKLVSMDHKYLGANNQKILTLIELANSDNRITEFEFKTIKFTVENAEKKMLSNSLEY